MPDACLLLGLEQVAGAGLLTAATGPRGGFRLAVAPARITLLQIIEAVDGASPFYKCNEIRQNGRGGLPQDQCLAPCGLAVRMAAAESAWRESLAGVTIADILAGLPDSVPGRTRALLTRKR